MSQRDDVFALYPETLVIGASITALITPIPYQNFCAVKAASGATVSFVAGATNSFGCTFAVAQRYPLSATEIFHWQNSGMFKLEVGGATATIYMARGLTAGSTQL